MYLQAIQASADEEIVDRFKDGFVVRFMRHCECICGPYSALLRRCVKTNEVDQIWIDFSDRFEPRHANDPFYPLPIHWYFDFVKYTSQSKAEKRRHLLESVQEVCLWCAQRMTWSTSPFEDAYRSLLSVDCKWSYLSKKAVPSPSGDRRVLLAMQLDFDEIELTAIVIPPTSRKEIARIAVGKIIPQAAYSYRRFPQAEID